MKRGRLSDVLPPILLLLLSVGADQTKDSKLAGYQPNTDVADISSIDLDQLVLENDIKWVANGEIEKALNVYQNGGHSKSYARLQLKKPLIADVNSGLVVEGHTVGGHSGGGGPTAIGTIYRPHFQGETKLEVLYENAIGCSVGGLPDGSRSTHDCLIPDGWVRVPETEAGENGTSTEEPYHYTYDVDTDNLNGRTLASLSEDADKRMRSNKDDQYYKIFQTFVDYYGMPQYGNEWIKAAAERRETTLTRGNMNLSVNASLTAPHQAQHVAFKIGTVVLNVWMSVIREMEVAVGDCRVGDRTGSAWDKAVAYYVGSLERPTNAKSTAGVLLHALADKTCGEHHTCEHNGVSRVNSEIMEFFASGRDYLVDGDCSQARSIMHGIEELMMVPLIQAVQHSAFIQDVEGMYDSTEHRAMGASYAAAILPLVHHCSEKDAKTIYEQMKLGYDSDFQPSWTKVRTAFERNYACLGVTCDQIGGAWNWHSKDYHEGAEPCGGQKKRSTLKGVMVSFFVLAVLVMGASFFYRRRRKAKTEPADKEEGEFVNAHSGYGNPGRGAYVNNGNVGFATGSSGFANGNGGIDIETFEEEPKSLGVKVPPRSSFGSAIFGGDSGDGGTVEDRLDEEDDFGGDNIL